MICLMLFGCTPFYCASTTRMLYCSRNSTLLSTTVPFSPPSWFLAPSQWKSRPQIMRTSQKTSFDTWKSNPAVVVFQTKKLCLKCRCKRCPLPCLRSSIWSRALECMCILLLSESNTLVERQQCQTSIVSTYAVTT